jgi:DNA-binding transcriptional ArsR family regulator
MKSLETRFKAYMEEATGQAVALEPMPDTSLPYYLQRQYGLYTVRLAPVALTAVFLLVPEAFTPTRFRQHLPQLAGQHTAMTCLVAEHLPGYVRKRLMEAQQPFVVPGVQMYLPMLGMEWRKRAAGKPARIGQDFAPATQALLFFLLQGRGAGGISPLGLSKQLGYSAMSMSRAISELEAAGIARVERVGRERLVRLAGSVRETWSHAKPYLRTPVLHEVRVPLDAVKGEQLPLAGETALAAMTSLAEPAAPCYAVAKPWWQVKLKAGLEPIPIDEPGTCRVQVWSYAPKILSSTDTVDPFSLYASLEDDPDERIEQALEMLMERSL